MIHPNSDISSFCEQYSSPIDIAPAKTGKKEKKKKRGAYDPSEFRYLVVL